MLASVAALTAASAQQPKAIFTTSVTGTGDLSTWADSGGLDGLAGADAVCRSRAAAAGLANSQNFVAWLSDSNDDAYCRAHGLSGKWADNCGQPTLPTSAGGWVRTDGYPFTPSIGALVTNGPWVPSRLDEFGNLVASPQLLAFTATTIRGDLEVNTCNDWSSASSSLLGDGGRLVTGGARWTQFVSAICSFDWHHLYCLESGAGPAVEPPPVHGAIAFLMPALGTATEFGGLSGGDALCRQYAADASLPAPESYMAWLSDGTVDAIDRFSYDGPWIRPDGVLIAQSKADLTDGEILAPLNVDSLGRTESGAVFQIKAWTGTSPDGSSTGETCDGWTSSGFDESGHRGDIQFVDSKWTQAMDSGAQCNIVTASLYCFSQVATGLGGRLFDDGFESGNTSSWSSTSP